MPSDPTNNDKELLLQIAAGDETAFSVLFDRYKDKLFTFLFRLTGSADAAEDLIQNIFLKLWTSRESLEEIEHFTAYIFRMGRNMMLNDIRKNARESLLLAEIKKEMATEQHSLSDPCDISELRQKLQEAVNRLPPQQKKIYQLSRESGLKREEIAAMLAISPSTVNNHLFQALKSIREYITPYLRGLAGVECFVTLLRHIAEKK
ncbi:MAG: RNA polymerase sigma-70 factor [Chitinophagaceae bacterium]|nr:RNA polymerase sigma-70 factor [Chitinophagaceae bacterium]